MKIKPLIIINLIALTGLTYLIKNIIDDTDDKAVAPVAEVVAPAPKAPSQPAAPKTADVKIEQEVDVANEQAASQVTTNTLPPATTQEQITVKAQVPNNQTPSNAPATAKPNDSVRVLLIPEKETTIASTLTARINKINGSLGKSFKAGQLLISFKCTEEAARISMSKAELSNAIDQHEAKVKMQGLDQASDVEVSMAASDANRARAQLKLHQAQAAKCRVYAPWGGRIAKIHVKNHMSTSIGEPLMDLVKNGPLKLKLNIPSIALANARQGLKFTVNIDETGKQYDAVVTAVNSRVDPISQTVEVEAKFTKVYPELLSGMSGVAYLSSFI